MKLLSRLLRVAALSTLPVAANATPLSDYNLILFGNLNPSGDVRVDGKTFIGGNLNANGVFGASLGDAAFNATNNVAVAGNINTGNLHIQNGYLGYGGSLASVNNVWCNESGLAQHNCVRHLDQAALLSEAAGLHSTLTAESAYFQGLAPSAGASVTGDNNNKTLRYTGGATDLAVFNLTGAELFSTGGWGVNMGAAAHFVINVSGEHLGGQGTNLNIDYAFADNILWNFYEAETINFQRNWVGSVLALDAVISTTNNFNGAVAASAYDGRGEFHRYQWSYTPPANSVPETTTGLLMLSGLSLLGLAGMRTKRSSRLV